MVGRVVDRMPHDSGPRESVIRRQVRIVGNRDVEAHRARRSTDRRTAGGSLKKVRACGNRSNAIKFGEAGTFERLPPPPAYNWYTSFFFLAGPGPLHEIAVSTFSRSSLGVQIRFHTCLFSLPPVYI